MATVYVPGVALTVLKGYFGSNPWAVTHHWRNATSTTPWTQADLDLLCLTVFNAWGTALKSQHCTIVDTREVDGTDLTNASGVGSVYTHAPVAGSKSGGANPSNICINVQNRIAARYRGGHPRTFWPAGGVLDMSGEANWGPSFTTSMANAVASFVNTVKAATFSFGTGSLNHVIPRYTYTITDDPAAHKYKRERQGLLSVDVVQSYFAVTKLGSMRRRLTP